MTRSPSPLSAPMKAPTHVKSNGPKKWAENIINGSLSLFPFPVSSPSLPLSPSLIPLSLSPTSPLSLSPRISFSQLASPAAFAREKGCEATRLHLSTDPMPGGQVTSDLQLICLHPPELCAWTAHARVRGRVILAVPLPVCKEGIYWSTHLSTCGHDVLTINEYPRLEGLQLTIYYDCGEACVLRRATTARSAAVIGSESLGARKRVELLFFEDCDFVVMRRIMTSDRMLPISVTEAWQLHFRIFLLLSTNAARFCPLTVVRRITPAGTCTSASRIILFRFTVKSFMNMLLSAMTL